MCKSGFFVFLNLIMITVVAVFMFQIKSEIQLIQTDIDAANTNGPSYFICWQLCKQYPWETNTLYCCLSQNSSSCQTKNSCFYSYIQSKKDELSSFDAKYTYQVVIEAVLCLLFVGNCCRSKPRRREYEDRARGEALVARLILQTVRLQRANRRITANRNRSILTDSFIADEKNESCAVCLDAFEQERVVKLNCDHLFHRNCIEEWIKANPTCPVCRAEQ